MADVVPQLPVLLSAAPLDYFHRNRLGVGFVGSGLLTGIGAASLGTRLWIHNSLIDWVAWVDFKALSTLGLAATTIGGASLIASALLFNSPEEKPGLAGVASFATGAGMGLLGIGKLVKRYVAESSTCGFLSFAGTFAVVLGLIFWISSGKALFSEGE